MQSIGLLKRETFIKSIDTMNWDSLFLCLIFHRTSIIQDLTQMMRYIELEEDKNYQGHLLLSQTMTNNSMTIMESCLPMFIA